MREDDISIDDFEIWLKTEKHKAIDAKNGGLLIARDGVWVDAFETFKKEREESEENAGTGNII